MEEQAHREQRDPALTPSRGWRLLAGIAAVVTLALLWHTHVDSPPLSSGDRDGEPADLVSTRNVSRGTDQPLFSAETTLPAEPLATAPSGTEETAPTTLEPTRIVNHLANLLSGTPDLDVGHLDTMIVIAQDPDQPLGERIAAIRWLARLGNEAAIEALDQLLLGDATTSIRTAVATALGECPHPEATRILIALLEDMDPGVVLGAIQGLAKRNDPDATLALATLLANDLQLDEVRAAAAAALGHHNNAANDLRLAFTSAEGTLASGVLEGLARQPLSESESIFRKLLADPDTPVEMKVEAIGALGEGTPEAADLLLELARSAEDPALRSAAIDALALFDEPGNTLDALGGLVLSEPSAEVRADLYNTLSLYPDQANEGSISPQLVSSTLSETTHRPQLEGYRMVASMLHDQYQAKLAKTFDTNMVAWLRDSAEHGYDRYTRHVSIDALRLANTPGAVEALIDLSYSADPTVSQSAQQALRFVAQTGGSYTP